ncbi:MAG: DNA-3-methyladenine glycosylase 2 [Oscillospiraceae bacterium]|nr:DNA-3-methyladenine glycosylase 2 [Oscillospiraceae bacterium]
MDFFIETDFFKPELTLAGGQAFRWTKTAGNGNRYFGIAGNRPLELLFEPDGIRLIGVADNALPFWLEYFDTGRDYKSVIERFSQDPLLKKACRYAYGLRLLRQEPFETLISFIISQNNNIPRIKMIIKRLCEGFGEKIRGNHFAFPMARVLAALEPSDLEPLKCGYRAKYIIDAARKVNSGVIDLNALYQKETEDIKQELLKIKGVGEKVADCVLLFAYGKSGAFPKDIWVKRVLSEFYPDGLPDCIIGNEGLAQQYLFEYIRNNHNNYKL